MLNRTNRTLSANFNRLNLGTRSLALVASGINGTVTLRGRLSRGDSPRDGSREAIRIASISMSFPHESMKRPPMAPCSSPADPWRTWRADTGPVAAVPVPVAVESSVVRSAGIAGPCRRGEATETPSRSHSRLRPCVEQVERSRFAGRAKSRPMYPGLQAGRDQGCDRVRAARPVAARCAATGG